MANRGKLGFSAKSMVHLVASGYFPCTARIDEVTEGRSDSGAVVFTWTPVMGMEAIPCAEGLPRISSLAAAGSEIDNVLVTELYDVRVTLPGYYPDITDKMRVTVIERNHIWDITSIMYDPQSSYTELNCSRTNPIAQPGL